jgi:hypothetical protein
MDMISMLLGTRSTEAMNRVIHNSSNQMTDLASKMLKAGVELKVKGMEMGKGQLLDLEA